MSHSASEAEGALAQELRLRERRWQNEVGHALLDKPFEHEGSALVFQRQFERIERALAGAPAGPLVEVGCGRGQLLEYLRRRPIGHGRLVVGVDPSIAVAGLPARGVAAVRADGEQLPFHDGSVAALVYSGALHHVVDYRRALREALRVLAPGGRLVVFEPSSSLFNRIVHRVLDPIVFRASLEYESPVDQHYKHAFQEEAVVDELARCGVSVRRSRSDFLAYPVTGCYAGSALARSPRLMRGLVALEGLIERAPAIGAVARIAAWRFLIAADKPWSAAPGAVGSRATTLTELLVCPKCLAALDQARTSEALACTRCGLVYRVEDGIAVLLAEEATRA